MKTSRHLRHLLRQHRAWAWLSAVSLAFALVGVQTLGLAHALVHGPASPVSSTAGAADPAADGDRFGHAAGGAHCVLFTALSAGHPLASPTATPDVVAAHGPVGLAAAPADCATAPVRAFDARGPPAPMTVLV